MLETPGHRLFTAALRTLGQIFETHREEYPFREILARLRERPPGMQFGVAIYEAGRSMPIDYYVIAEHQGKFKVVSQGETPDVVHWAVNVEELRKLTDDPQTYVEYPGKLDLGWLTRRLGLSE